jgi:hypothetical protein
MTDRTKTSRFNFLEMLIALRSQLDLPVLWKNREGEANKGKARGP